MELTSTEHAIILGTLLGDGFLQKRAKKARLRICHSVKQKEYVDWKYQQLIRLCQRTSLPQTKTVRFGVTYSFTTQSEKILLKYYSLFYKHGLKIIRSQLIDVFKDPLSLAIWWLDDGNARLDAGRLATQAFRLAEHKILQQLLLQNFNIQTNIVKHSALKKQYYLYIPNQYFSELVDLIHIYVQPISTMQYKLRKPRND
uniref:Homing endonuclease LAGLIDADG domain-containing protein n=1 Tax=Pseudocodium devriesii TaxID=453070 RepID=A0A386B111_9CHLO|nr:hypothetical protein [Pseudocodium devriesii]AYC65384.1 hypothetical protein [Pseudocodium devriesii]